MKIADTDNFGGDYPNEKFMKLGPYDTFDIEEADTLAHILNNKSGEEGSRFYKVVDDAYELAPGFEP